jgi:hypothetical protein
MSGRHGTVVERGRWRREGQAAKEQTTAASLEDWTVQSAEAVQKWLNRGGQNVVEEEHSWEGARG